MNADEKSQLWKGTSMLLGLLVFVLVAVIPIAIVARSVELRCVSEILRSPASNLPSNADCVSNLERFALLYSTVVFALGPLVAGVWIARRRRIAIFMLVASLLTLATEAILIWLLKDWTSGAGWLIVFVPIVIPAGIVWRLRFKRGHITGIVTIVVLFAMGVGGVFFPPLGSFAAGVAALVGAGIGVVLPTGRDLNQFSPPLGARET